MLRNPHDALWYNSITREAVDTGAIESSAMSRGKGCWVQDASGTWYLDARAAMWNTTLGYDAERVVEAMTGQLRRLPVAQIIRYEEPSDVALEYARRLVDTLPDPLNHVRFGSTGSQMTTAAVLLSRFVRKVAGQTDRTKVIAFTNGYHGTGGIAGALTGERQMHALQAPLVPDVHHVKPWNLEALAKTVERHGPEHITAIIVEPVMGTDVLAAPDGALRHIRDLCDRHGIHLIADEVTTGFGRTGAMSVMADNRVLPDLLVLGKGITSGYFPLAALVCTDALFDEAISRPEYVFPHGCTADGHPVGMAAGLAVLDELADGSLFGHVRAVGEHLRQRLREHAATTALIHDVRGAGLMIGVELRDGDERPGAASMAEVRRACQEAGLLLTTTNSTLVLMPPLVLTETEADELVKRLVGALDDVAAARS
ncbi:aminotransferase family protein [Streptomyces candidus]|uniref:Adenosylmethionine-8-amino-7-oxononanoate aminotransferase n=1 Tax=Streptomyces candidus TaxID=67283 RepID=A0A7X0HJ43_9ACTN|nr:aminotransferase class III-fold pyridoxal phosphate-dependent enzyme [Streptomyces candidus]MBB6438632.1 adenosylmethionine-8-amino-7-oxononanoate aminotransferase [Streptomyces candidus]GHH45247.1 aspartate aminotransferase family protein [Streptomyces candidus]